MKKIILKSIALTSMAFSANVFAQCDDTNFAAWTDMREDVAGQLDAVAPGMNGSGCKMAASAAASRDNKARVQDKSPVCENSYRARFVINVDSLGILASNERNKVFNAQCTGADSAGVSCSNLGQIQFKLQGDGAGGNMFRVFVIDENQPNADNRRKLDVPVSAGDQPFELQWIRASSAVSNDGVFRIWSNGNSTEASPDFQFADMNNFNACISQINLGLVGPNQNFADGNLNTQFFFDEFESRRQTGIGVN